jgi:hypothetical protein
MSEALDNHTLDTVRRRRAELEAHLGVIAAQRKLSWVYTAELEEIDAFLASVEALTEEDK